MDVSSLPRRRSFDALLHPSLLSSASLILSYLATAAVINSIAAALHALAADEAGTEVN